MQEPVQTNPLPPTHDVENEPKRGGNGVVFLASAAFLIAVICLVLQFFFWELHKRRVDEIIQQGQQMQLLFRPQFSQLSSELNNQKQELNNQRQLLNKLNTKNQYNEKRVNLLRAEEVEHLLNLAQYILIFEGNIETATKLITSADQKLQAINEPSLNTLRQALITHITALNASPKVDVTSILSRISAISDQVSSLSTVPVIPPAQNVRREPTRPLTLKEKLMDTFRSLHGIISIRRLPEEVKPLASQEQQTYMVEKIRLELMQAEWAVLHQNPTLYKASLDRARADLEKYYAHNQYGANLIKIIDDLSQINIKPPVPDLSNEISWLHDYIQNMSNILNEPQSPPIIDSEPSIVPKTNTDSPSELPASDKQSTSGPSATENLKPKNNHTPAATTNPTPRALPS